MPTFEKLSMPWKPRSSMESHHFWTAVLTVCVSVLAVMGFLLTIDLGTEAYRLGVFYHNMSLEYHSTISNMGYRGFYSKSNLIQNYCYSLCVGILVFSLGMRFKDTSLKY